MTNPVTRFINSCSEKYRKAFKNGDHQFNLEYLPHLDFDNLSEEKKIEIIKYINSFNINERYAFDKLPDYIQNSIQDEYKGSRYKERYTFLTPEQKIEKLKNYSQPQGSNYESKEEIFAIDITVEEYHIITRLQNVLDGNDDLDSIVEETAIFQGGLPEVSSSITFQDQASLEQMQLENSQGEYYIDGNKATIAQEDGYIKLRYQITNLKEKFSQELDKCVFQAFADKNLIDKTILLGKGMLPELGIKNEFNDFSTSDFRIMRCLFKDGNSFLHYAVRNMEIQYLRSFINNIPVIFKKEYLNLTNSDGLTIEDLVSDMPDKLKLIRSYIGVKNLTNNNQNILINKKQSTHSSPIHMTADTSLVRLAKNMFQLTESSIENNGRKIIFNHNEVLEYVNESLKQLQYKLSIMMSYREEQLYEDTAQFLDESQKTLPKSDPIIQKILGFRRFQIEKAVKLVNDIITDGFVGNAFRFDASIPIENGLSVKEIIALCYNATKDIENLIISTKIDENNNPVPKRYEEGTSDEQQQFLNEIKWNFINHLYQVIRGYNIEYGIDNPDAFKFDHSVEDKPICIGGTVNMLATSVSNIHKDVNVATVNLSVLKLRILNYIPYIINNIIKESNDEAKTSISFQLKEWKNCNKMPKELKDKVSEKLKSELSNPTNEIIIEYGELFDVNEIKLYAEKSLNNFSYPNGKIINISKYEILLFEEASIRNLNILPKYTRDENGNYKLTLIYMLEKNPNSWLICWLKDIHYLIIIYYQKKDMLWTLCLGG